MRGPDKKIVLIGFLIRLFVLHIAKYGMTVLPLMSAAWRKAATGQGMVLDQMEWLGGEKGRIGEDRGDLRERSALRTPLWCSVRFCAAMSSKSVGYGSALWIRYHCPPVWL